MKYTEAKRRLDKLQRVRRRVLALFDLGLISSTEWAAFNGVFSEELTRVIELKSKP